MAQQAWVSLRAAARMNLENKKWQQLHNLLRVGVDSSLIVAGSLLMAIAVTVFLNPNDVVPGGFTALAIFANRLWGWQTGVTLLLLNIPFLLIGIALLGKEFGPKTLLATTLSALLIEGIAPYVPTVTGEPLLYIAYGGLLYGLGLALVFRANATTGGTEIPAKLLERFAGIRMARALMMMDLLILAAAGFFFGLEPALYALIAAWIMSRVIDAVEFGFDATVTTFIVTAQPERVKRAILKMERGVTMLQGEGGYTGEGRTMIFTAVHRRQLRQLRDLLTQIDPEAFVVINPSHDVLGEGFKPLTRIRANSK